MNFPKKSVIGWYNRLRLSQKLLLSFLLVSVLPILLIQTSSYYLITVSMNDKISELTRSNLLQSSDKLDITFSSYTDILYQIYIDDLISEHVEILGNSDAQQNPMSYNIISERLKYFVSAKEGIRSISIICKNGQSVTYDAQIASSIDNLWRDYRDLRTLAPYLRTIDQNSMVLTPTQVVESGGETSYLFHVSKALYDLRDLSKGSTAVVIVSVDESVLDSVCNLRQNGSDALSHSMSFILDSKNRIVSFPYKEYIGHNVAEYTGSSDPKPENITDFVRETEFFGNRALSVSAQKNPQTGWTLYHAFDRNYMFQDIQRTQLLTIIIAVFAIVASSVVIRYTVKRLVRSVQQIVSGMKRVQDGDLETQVTVKGNDEISAISEHFNRMVYRLRLLIEEVRGATNKQKEAEIRALEAQINPHFLYNTLDSINWMAIEKEEYEISKMLRNLGMILRYSIEKSNHIVTIEQELDWLQKYIDLQQNRFNHSFSCEMQIDPDLLDKKLYKLLLQPFIENAILHAFQGVEEGGLIRVCVSQKEDSDGFCILIEDNGKGMPPELAAMYNNRAQAVSDDGRSIGMHNAFARMNMYYGDQASWTLCSKAGEGTSIHIQLPDIVPDEKRMVE